MAGRITFFNIFCFLTVVLAGVRVEGNCTDAELEALGYKRGELTDEKRAKALAVAACIKKAAKASMTLTKEKDTQKVVKKIEKELKTVEVDAVSAECLTCFAKSVQCAIKHCKGACIGGDLSENCRQCMEAHCDADFRACVGAPTIDLAQLKA
ncbi:hypothetical protein BgAZ_100300 [Babesia gibsoni]|uniref:Surface protein D n=1 Tax=Babesia gibsoni TaxID=33632 RepID=A0AAD8PF38_BABGI|nr:hypothetical protein BgAZ_100300 [Babesia gibsoni]